MTEKNEAFPTAFQAMLLIVAVFLIQVLMGTLLSGGEDPWSLAPDELSTIAAVLGNGAVLVFAMQVKDIGYRQLLHASSASANATFFLLLGPILMLIPALVWLMSTTTGWLIELMPLSAPEEALFEDLTAQTLPAILTVCVLAPVLEEMLFRGVILRGFLHRYPRWVAIVFSAMLFGAAHLNIYQFMVATVLGVLAGWLYERTRSLLPCIVLHGAYNTSLTVLDAIDAGDDALAWAPVWWWVPVLALAWLGLRLLKRWLTPARP